MTCKSWSSGQVLTISFLPFFSVFLLGGLEAGGVGRDIEGERGTMQSELSTLAIYSPLGFYRLDTGSEYHYIITDINRDNHCSVRHSDDRVSTAMICGVRISLFACVFFHFFFLLAVLAVGWLWSGFCMNVHILPMLCVFLGSHYASLLEAGGLRKT